MTKELLIGCRQIWCHSGFAASVADLQTWGAQWSQSLPRGDDSAWGNRACDQSCICCCLQHSVERTLLHPELRLQEYCQRQHRGAGALCLVEQELVWSRGQPVELQSFPHQHPPAWGKTRAAWATIWSQWFWGVWSKSTGGGLRHHVQFL